MATRRTSAKRKQPTPSGILLRYREKDTAYGVTRKTTTKLANTLGLSETQVVHVALANLARQTLPRYEAQRASHRRTVFGRSRSSSRKGFVSSTKNRLF